MKYRIKFDIDFQRNPYKGKYIVIEGIDGSGKSTQIQNIAEFLTDSGHTVKITGEPGPGQLVEKLIRQILTLKISIPSSAFQYLYSADRAINHQKIIEPALKQGKIVISHRNFWSVIAHGVLDRGEDKHNNQIVNYLMIANGIISKYHQFVAPDFTFLLDVPVDSAMKRLTKMRKGTDLYERREKLIKIKEGYNWVLKNFPKEIILIDGEKPTREITEEIFSKMSF